MYNGWLNEVDADALQQLLTPHNELLVNEGSVSCHWQVMTVGASRLHQTRVHKVLSEHRTFMQHSERGPNMMAKAQKQVYTEWYLSSPRIYKGLGSRVGRME